MSKSTKIISSIALVGCSVLAAVSLFELVLRLLGFPSENVGIYTHPPNFLEQRSNIEFSYTFRTNSQGLRYKEIPLEKPVGTTRVLVLGDSFVEGFGVRADQTFSAVLENDFSGASRPVNFINGGLSGTGPLQYARLFLNVGLRYEPDVLLVCVYANDLAGTELDTKSGDIYEGRRGIRRLASFLWPRVYTQLSLFRARNRHRPPDFVAAVTKRARELNVPEEKIAAWRARLPPDLVAAVNRGEFNGAILSGGLLHPRSYLESIDIEGVLAEQKWLAMRGILHEIVSIADDYGIKMGLVYVPARFQYDPSSEHIELRRLAGSQIRDEWLTEETEIQRRLEDWAKREGLPFLDLTLSFRKAIGAEEGINWILDGHWSARGHRVAAEAIAEWLKYTPKLGLRRNDG